MSKFKGPIPKASMSLEEALSLPLAKGIAERCITAETCKHFDVRAEFHESEGTVVAYLFPVTKNNRVTGFKRLVRDGRCSKKVRFSTVGDVTEDSDYIGARQASKGKKLFITEGEYDMLSLFQVLSAKYDHKYTPAVTSLVSGVNTASSGAAANNALIANFEELITVYDSDDQGQEAVQATALIQPHLKNVLLELKDAGEYLTSGKSEELVDKVFKPAEYNIEEIKFGAVDIADLMRPTAKGVMLDVLPLLMDKLKGLREAEFTVVLAPPKSGKTTLCKHINYALLKAGRPCMGIYLEEDLVKTQQSFIALDWNIHLPSYRSRPDQLTKEQVQSTMDTVLNPSHAFFCDDKTGHLTPDKLMAVLMWAAIKGCKFVILDHISFVFSGLKASDERKEIDKLLTDIAAFVKQTGVHVVAVAHVVMDRNRGKERDKEGIVYPYWYNTEDTDGRGSGAFAQLCHNMIGIDKQMTELGQRGHTRVRVLFNREWDYTGVCDELTLNKHSGWLESV